MNWLSRLCYSSENSIEALWRMASTASLHGAFCACAGGGAFAISPQQLEEDILDYLADRYIQDAFVIEELRRRMGSRSDPFCKWFEGLVVANGMRNGVAESLRQDVLNILRSIANPEGGLICS